MTENLNTVDGRQRLRIERRLGHPPAKVWRALTEPDELRHWFPAEVRLEPRAGGRITFGADSDQDFSVITAYDPPRLLAFGWGGDTLRFEVTPDGPGSLLVFEHTFDTRSAAASYASGWQACFEGLDRVLAGRPAELPGEPSAAAHEHFVRAFGLDEGAAETTEAGWRVRFDRQLTQPAEKVWAVLLAAGPDPAAEPVVGGPVPAGFGHESFPAAAVAAVDAPRLCEYGWRADDSDPGQPVGRIRWELAAGTGHGARLLLTVTGPEQLSGHRDAALTGWRRRINELADQLR
ncbi:SRPBCC family protein [Solwaraspora sp. WMMD1047]|uniref:SRPBCC family protein n=1 Tax=Solwaraspora sp. WMMD1047 TaxID=3016102 RepID=UPI002417D649|nr:SRPBCC family protein [Solwaraspora sp. WMMD1047]MDG4830956.1 SRPBCC family protein [Solwaraspora sp. WMMD1047]